MSKKLEEKKENQIKKGILYYVTVGLIILTTVNLVGLVVHCYWKSKNINDADGYNSIDASIALMALLVNVITIIFVYATYQKQKEQIDIQREEIEDNKKDVEFNRALEIIYRQLEFTRVRFKPENAHYIYTDYESKLVNLGNKFDYDNDIENLYTFKFLENLKTLGGIDNVLSFLEIEFKLYKNMLEGLEKKQKLKLINIITWNIDIKLEETIRVSYDVYSKYKSSYKTNLRDEEEYQILDGNIVTNFEKIINFLNADFR